MPSSPSPPSFYQRKERPCQEPQQQQQPPADEQNQVRARAAATAQSFAMRKQWSAKAASFQRGLQHVQHCTAGDACGSSLCHSTRRLMQTVANHPCPKQQHQHQHQQDCRVCKLWAFLTQQPQLPRLERALAQQGATSCGAASRNLARSSVVQRRIATANKTQLLRRF